MLHRLSLVVFLLLKTLEKFKEDWYKLLFVCLIEFSFEAIWSWTFVYRECFLLHIQFHFLLSIFSVDLFLLDSVLAGSKYLESCLFLLCCQICWHIIIHSILSWFFVFLQYWLRFLLFHFLFCLSGFFLSSSW